MITARFCKVGLGSLAVTVALGVGYVALTSGPTLAQAKGLDEACTVCGNVHKKSFSRTFNKARPQEVVNWMQAEGIHLKVTLADLPSTLLTMTFNGLDEEGILRSFGNAVGMQPVNRDGVYSLMRGVGGDSTSETLGSEDSQDRMGRGAIIGPDGFNPRGWRTAPGQDGLDFVFDFEGFAGFADFEDFDFGQDFDVLIPDVGAIIKEVMAALEEAGIQDGDKKLTKEQRAKLKALLEKRLGGLQERLGSTRFIVQEKLSREQLKKLQERMEGMELRFNADDFKVHMKEFGDLFGDGKVFLFGADGLQLKELKELKGLDELRGQDGRKFKILMEEGMKAREKALQQLKERLGERGEKLRIEGFDSKAFEKMMQERFGENSEFMKQMEKMQGKLKIEMKGLRLKLENLKKFMDSLTDDQKALAKKQGHLEWEDLTKAQQKLLGEFGKDGGSIRFNIDDRGVTIKKDKKVGISA